MHPVLQRQLKKAGIDPEVGATAEQLAVLLSRVASSYDNSDRERYLLERSLMMTSQEMQELYDAQRRASETAIAEERDKLRAVLVSLSDGLIILDPEGVVTLLNPEAERILGREAAGCTGQSVSEIGHFEDVTGATVNLLRFCSEPIPVVELDGTYVDGNRTVPVSYHLNPISQPGRVLGAVLVFRDITDLKAASAREQALREAGERTTRLESVGLLAGGVAHDLNNILGPMVVYPKILLEELPPDSELIEDVEAIEESARRAAAVIQDLLTMARQGAYSTEPVSVNRVVLSVLRGVALQELNERRPDVAITTDLAHDLPAVDSSPGRVNQVVLNLIKNASEAMPNGGSIHIATREEVLRQSKQGYEPIAAGNYVVLDVQDDGEGISPEDLERVMEPFYTKKKMGRSGSGLGLAVVYGVVRDAGGGLTIKSTVGAGTRFQLYFPSTGRRSVMSTAELPAASGGEVVLIVDDVAQQRRLGARILTSLGYTVFTAENGRAALRWLSARRADLLVLDMIMEDDFDGLDTWVNAVQVQPDLRCIITSGFSQTARVREAQRRGAGPLVEKPYTREAIATALRAELDRTDP